VIDKRRYLLPYTSFAFFTLRRYAPRAIRRKASGAHSGVQKGLTILLHIFFLLLRLDISQLVRERCTFAYRQNAFFGRIFSPAGGLPADALSFLW